jgi:hypothetical protein
VILKKSSFYLLLSCLPIIFTRCANPVAPQGGPKDVRPPVILSSEPPNFSTHFSSRRVKITFNEFIQLKDVRNQVLISPPLLPKTEYSLHGKSLLIKFDDSLKANTTYSIIFGEAISDLTENNVLHNFNYVFTTGDRIDSLSLPGSITDAFTTVPQKDVYAMLYVNENDTIPFDSLPYLVKPYYLAKTNEAGEFIFHNLRNVPYKLFALKDMNGDYIYNINTEKIAFCDSLAQPAYVPPTIHDSLQGKDTLVKKDTAIHLSQPGTPSYPLRLFEQVDSTQKLLRSELVQEKEVRLVFRFPAKNPEFIPLNFTPDGTWQMTEFSSRRDTVILWLVTVPADSLTLKISDTGYKPDTAILDLTPKNRKKSSRIKEKPETLQFSTNLSGNKLNQFRNDLEITFSYPVSRGDFSRILLISGKDTVKPKVAYAGPLKRKIRISVKWKEEQNYKIIIPDSSFFSMNELANDSLVTDFRTSAMKDFGTFKVEVTMDKRPGNYIIQLLDAKERVMEERRINKPEKLEFDYMLPGNYKLKAILDKNQNGRWDAGVYLEHIQPEEVFYFPKPIEVRANWDIDETWPL